MIWKGAMLKSSCAHISHAVTSCCLLAFVMLAALMMMVFTFAPTPPSLGFGLKYTFSSR